MDAYKTRTGNYLIKADTVAAYISKREELLRVVSLSEYDHMSNKLEECRFNVNNNNILKQIKEFENIISLIPNNIKFINNIELFFDRELTEIPDISNLDHNYELIDPDHSDDFIDCPGYMENGVFYEINMKENKYNLLNSVLNSNNNSYFIIREVDKHGFGKYSFSLLTKTRCKVLISNI